jgi:hypothetical protein
MEVVMLQKSRHKVALSILITLFGVLIATHIHAAEYSHVYRFEEPRVVTLRNDRQILQMEGTWPKDDLVGAPLLPVKTCRLFIPANERVVATEIGYGTLKTIEGSYVIQHATTPRPLSHKGPFTVDPPRPDIYERNASFPSSVHKTRKPQFLRGEQIILVDVMPVIYNPLQGQLKYYEELEVRIKTEKRKKPDWVMPFRNSPQDRKRILRTIENDVDFLKTHPGPEQEETADTSSMGEASSPTGDSRQYVVITTTNLVGAFQALTDHRALPLGGGYTTYIEDVANIEANYPGIDLAEKMRNFIKGMYINHETQYVVLGGDCDGPPGEQVIPTRGCYAAVGSYTDDNIPSDLYFGCLDGTWNGDGDDVWGESDDGEGGGDIDWESEVYVGRIPADNDSEAINQINKIIAFETTEHPDRTLLVGEQLDSDPTWGGDRMDWIYSHMGTTPKTELYDRDWENHSWPKSQLLSHINSNAHHWINHLGHSSVTYNMKLSNSDVGNMSNNKYLLVYTQGCYSGSIDSRYSSGSYGGTDCFGESITNTYDDRGAFAYVGNSRYGWYNPGTYVEGASNLVHKEFVETVFTDNITKLGEANQVSKTDLDLGSGTYRWIAFQTNLLGCPATDLSPRVCFENADCDDGLYCNGSETCVGGICQSGTAPNCNDDIPCTIDSCNEDADSCDNLPDNGLCDDGLFCSGTETCDLFLGCQDGIDPCPGQGCDEETESCVDLNCGNEVCDGFENCHTCPEDCISGQGGGTCEACFKGVCNGDCHPKKEGPDCADCAPGYCCGDGVCEGAENSYNCEIDCGPPPFCGDGHCDAGEDQCDCPEDCGQHPNSETGLCTDGADNDCDGSTDCGDSDCESDPACNSECGERDAPCGADEECCSNRCHRGKCK